MLLQEEEEEDEDEDEESVKIMFYLYFIPGVIFSFYFLHTVTFLHVIHFDVLRRQIEIETESENRNFLMYGYNAGPPMAIPIYTVLPYCVIHIYVQCFGAYVVRFPHEFNHTITSILVKAHE